MPITSTNKNRLNAQTMKIVHTALDQLGIMGDFVTQGNNDIFPVLMQCATILVLREEEHHSMEEISQILGLPLGAVRSVLESPTQGYEERLPYVLDENHEFDRHTQADSSEMPISNRLNREYLVGALAKSAYTIVRRTEGTTNTGKH